MCSLRRRPCGQHKFFPRKSNSYAVYTLHTFSSLSSFSSFALKFPKLCYHGDSSISFSQLMHYGCEGPGWLVRSQNFLSFIPQLFPWHPLQFDYFSSAGAPKVYFSGQVHIKSVLEFVKGSGSLNFLK